MFINKIQLQMSSVLLPWWSDEVRATFLWCADPNHAVLDPEALDLETYEWHDIYLGDGDTMVGCEIHGEHNSVLEMQLQARQVLDVGLETSLRLVEPNAVRAAQVLSYVWKLFCQRPNTTIVLYTTDCACVWKMLLMLGCPAPTLWVRMLSNMGSMSSRWTPELEADGDALKSTLTRRNICDEDQRRAKQFSRMLGAGWACVVLDELQERGLLEHRTMWQLARRLTRKNERARQWPCSDNGAPFVPWPFWKPLCLLFHDESRELL